MSSADDRIQRLEAGLDQLRPSLSERLERLEKSVDILSARPPITLRGRFLAWMGAELPKFLAAALLLLIGWGIKDSVDLSIKQRQLDLSYAKELQGLLQTMADPNASVERLNSTASVVASYGEGAMPSLLSELRHLGLRANAAIDGIRVLALLHRETVCDTLPIVLSDRSRQFDWETQASVAGLLGENMCKEARETLVEFRAIVDEAQHGATGRFAEIVRRVPDSPADSYPDLVQAVDNALARLKP